jgi:lysophospholipase L1-like esterase
MTRSSPASPQRAGWKGHVMGITFMCALTLALSELVLGLYRDPIPTDGYSVVHQASLTPGLIFEPKPSSSVRLRTSDYDTEVTINSFGMRGPEPSPPERMDIQRVVAVGDSFTFGMGVEAEEAWPALLQERLDQPGRPVEALNLGVCGYTIEDYLAVLERKTPVWGPRVAVVGYYFNDPDTLPLNPLQHAFLPTLSPYQLKIGFFSLMVRRSLDYRRSGETDYFRMLHSDQLSYWPNTLAALERMAEISRERSVELIVAVFPRTPEDWSEYGLRPLHEKVDAALRERGIQYVDLMEALSPYTLEQVRISIDDDHPTPFGHQIIAEALAPVVEAALDRQALTMR